VCTYLRQCFKWIFWFALVASLLVSCQSAPAENASQEVVLCGQEVGGRARLIRISTSGADHVALRQAIELPGTEEHPCPRWLDQGTAWLYGDVLEGYERDVYLLDLAAGQIELWFRLRGDEQVMDVELSEAGDPRALILSSRENGMCAAYETPESRWQCLHARGDLYLIDEEGIASRLTEAQAPLCEAALGPGAQIAAFHQSDNCLGHHSEAPSTILLVDTSTRQVRAFEGNQGMELRWSPHAQRLAFLGWSEREEGQLYLYDVREDQRVLLGERVVADVLRWSPQGRYLAWISSSPSAAQVVVFDVASGEKVTFPAPDVSGSLRWSSDERYVAWRTASGFTFAAMEDLTVESMAVQSSSVRDWAFGEDVVVSLEALSGQIRLVSRAGEVPVDHLGDLDLNDFRWLQVRWVQ
jgi:hypothetical protein